MPSITNRKLAISDRITLTKIHHPLTVVVVDGRRDGPLISGLDSSWKVESDKHDSLTVVVDGREVRPTVNRVLFLSALLSCSTVLCQFDYVVLF